MDDEDFDDGNDDGIHDADDGGNNDEKKNRSNLVAFQDSELINSLLVINFFRSTPPPDLDIDTATLATVSKSPTPKGNRNIWVAPPSFSLSRITGDTLIALPPYDCQWEKKTVDREFITPELVRSHMPTNHGCFFAISSNFRQNSPKSNKGCFAVHCHQMRWRLVVVKHIMTNIGIAHVWKPESIRENDFEIKNLHDLRFVNIAYMHPDLRLRVIPFVDYQMSYFRPSNTFQPNPLGGSYIDFYSSAYSTALNAYKTPSRPPRKRGKRKRGKGGKRVQFTNPNPTPYPFLTLYVVASSPLSKNLGRIKTKAAERKSLPLNDYRQKKKSNFTDSKQP
jgi:hypothetical protein